MISKELFNWTDTYVIDVANSNDALTALMLVLAIDAEKCSRRDESFPKKAAPHRRGRKNQLAAAGAKTAQKLPNRAAISIAASVASKEEHICDLLSMDLSREDKRIVTYL